MAKNKMKWTIVLVVLAMLATGQSEAQDKWQRVINLAGKWRFSIGDKQVWADRYYNDSQWEMVFVSSPWEEQGFNGYDGYAWYRTSFDGKELQGKDNAYALFLGYIDDVDEAYLNGHKIGASGAFPPDYRTAYDAFRNYNIPKEYLDFGGKNVIAVKVYDAGIEGGIVSGDVGIYVNRADQGVTINLRGVWDFRLAENGREWNTPIDDAKINSLMTAPGGWVDIMVPSLWERQGFADYDGGAWYRRKFTIPKDMAGEDLVLLMGKIDDSDRTYLNGKLVGSTHEEYDKFRMYQLSANQFKPGEVNVLLVYVDDPHGDGGIYEGPVGFMKQSEFTRYIRWRK